MTNNFKSFLKAIAGGFSDNEYQNMYESFVKDSFTKEELERVGDLYAQYKETIFKNGIPWIFENEEYSDLVKTNSTAKLMEDLCEYF